MSAQNEAISNKRFVEVVLPLPVAGVFTYSLPEGAEYESVTIGSRVVVPFGTKKYYTGIVTGYAAEKPKDYEVKDIFTVLDSKPILRHPQLRFWEWMAEYYICALGDIYKAAIPAGLKIESETVFEVNPDYDEEMLTALSERELFVYQQLEANGKMNSREIEKATGFKNMTLLLQRMADKGAVIISENLVNRYTPKKEKLVRIAFSRYDEEALAAAFAAVKQSKKQEAVLQTLLHLSGFTIRNSEIKDVLQETLLEKSAATTPIIKALEDKGLVERYTRETSRFSFSGTVEHTLPTLSPAQNEALQAIHKSFFDKGVTLLRGVTSSGKTEIYIHLIDYVLSQGNQALLLVPEIALTTQLTTRLQRVFGNKVVIYHSKFTDNQRVDIWKQLLNSSEPCVVIGARSAVFLPFSKLGMVIVDEEHDSSYKQQDPSPRYNGRDAAILLAYMHGAKTLLGSATPAVDTYWKALSGKYGLVELTERFGDAVLPRMEIVDMAVEGKRKQVRGSFALSTIKATNNTISDGRQAILFHNRRGFAPMARCKMCQFIPKCQYCDVSLTYHRRDYALVCHYCGAVYPLPDLCPACKEPSLEVVGYGTERIEEEVEENFPTARILRMDLDTTRAKDSYDRIIDTFSEHKADILVGTQMVTKGLDFGDVSLVAVLNADSIINFPDFHASERAFNMLEQVAGRSGRRADAGKVMIQTRNPESPVISFLKSHDYIGFYNYEIEERRKFNYPPFARVIYINLKHRDERELDEAATLYAERLKQLFGNRVSGVAKPPVARIQLMYIRRVMLKVELAASMAKVKEILRDLNASLYSAVPTAPGAPRTKFPRNLVITYDVDPM